MLALIIDFASVESKPESCNLYAIAIRVLPGREALVASAGLPHSKSRLLRTGGSPGI